MTKPIHIWAIAATLMFPLVISTSSFAQTAKTAKACEDEYKADKANLKAAKENKKDFLTACKATPAGQPTAIGAATAPAAPAPTKPAPTVAPPVTGQGKTASACEAEYKANKAALKSAKESKKDFLTACKALPAGQPTPVEIGTGVATPSPAPQQTTAAPAAPAPAPASPPPATRAQPAPSPTGANEFSNEASAKARCPSATVVWVNVKSKIYHFAGTKNYGNTKEGAYMCETDATAAGDRASKTEKHP